MFKCTTQWPPPKALTEFTRKLADSVRAVQSQEYKFVDGEWWLYELGKKLRRVTTEDEIEYAKKQQGL